MKNLSHILTRLAAAALLVAGVVFAPATRAEMVPDVPQSDPRHPSLADFDLIAQRNIFDPNRGVAQALAPTAPTHRPVVETFSFRGAAEKVGQGVDAFFIGYGTPVSGVLTVNDTINGFKVVRIGLHEVQLLDPTHDDLVTLTAETGLSREDGGPWKKVAAPTFAATATKRGLSGWDGPGRAARDN